MILHYIKMLKLLKNDFFFTSRKDNIRVFSTYSLPYKKKLTKLNIMELR